MALKNSLYSEKGYSKQKNKEMSLLANSLTSLADGEIDQIKLTNNEDKIKLTITEKKKNSELFDVAREDFKSSLKSNTGLLPYYIAEYFGNKEVPRYLTKGEAAYAMTVNPSLELLGVKGGKGGSTIISKEPISLENNGDYDKYKTFLTLKASDTPAIDKVLSKFENLDEKDYDNVLTEEAGKILQQMLSDVEKEETSEPDYNEEEDVNDENYFDSEEDESTDVENDKITDAFSEYLTTDDEGQERDTDSEVLEDINEITRDVMEEKEKENDSSTYEEEVLNEI